MYQIRAHVRNVYMSICICIYLLFKTKYLVPTLIYIQLYNIVYWIQKWAIN